MQTEINLKSIELMRQIKYTCVLLITLLAAQPAFTQDNAYILDRVVAVVGDFHVLQSDIEEQYLQMQMNQQYIPDNIKCDILNYFIEQKLMMSQAKIDSIEVADAQVELSMESRLNMFISQFGSEEEMEAYFNKSIYDIREDLRKTMKEMMITQQVQQTVVGDVQITPSDVKSFYSSIPKDSIPYIESEVRIARILAYPPVNENAVFEVRERLLELRERIMNGESMSTLAILYSDDPSATSNFGEIGFRSKSELDPAYVEAAWSLKEGQVSKIVESSFGYHIIQSIERRGERLNTRHILMQPKISAAAKTEALAKLDSIRTLIEADSMTFHIAAIKESEDEKTRANGGLVVNPNTQSATFKYDELDTRDYYVIREMEIGDISAPYESQDDNGKLCYKMIKLIHRTEPHRANLQQDYLLLQNMAMQEKQNEVMEQWFEEKRKKTYIRIDKSFEDCDNFNQELTDR